MGAQEGGTSQAGRLALGCLSVIGFLLALASTDAGSSGGDSRVASPTAAHHASAPPPSPPLTPQRVVEVALPADPEPVVVAPPEVPPAEPEPVAPVAAPVAAEEPVAPPAAAPAPPDGDLKVAAAPPAPAPSLLGGGIGIASAGAVPAVPLPVVGEVLAPVITPVVEALPLRLGL